MATRRSIRNVGLNFAVWSRVALGAGVLLIALTQIQVARCTFDALGETALPAVEIDAERGASDAVVAVAGEEGFFARLGSGVSSCRAAHPIIEAPLWMLLGCLGCFVASIVFTVLGRIDYTRQVRAASAKQRKARKSLRRERAARTGSDQLPPTDGDGSAPDISGAPATPSEPKPVDLPEEEDDVLAALDAQIAARECASIQAATATEAEPSQPTELPSLDDLEDADWDGFNDEPSWSAATDEPALAPPPPAATQSGAGSSPIDPLAPTVAPVGAEKTEARRAPGSRQPSIDGLTFGAPLMFGRELLLCINSAGFGPEDAPSCELSLTLIDSKGVQHSAWAIARSVSTAGRLSLVDGGAEIRVPWNSVHEKVIALSRAEGGGVAEVVATARCGNDLCSTRAPLLDNLDVDFRDPVGAPIRQALARITTADGVVRLGWVGAERPGRLSVTGIPPGACRIEFEDASQLMYPGGVPGWTISLASTGPAFAAADGSTENAAVHDLVAIRPMVLHVSATADAEAADGSRAAPFAHIGAALQNVRDARDNRSPGYESVEIRVDPTAQLPSGRHGLVFGPNGESQWLNWWRGLAADTSVDWTQDDNLDALREAARYDTSAVLREDVVIDAMDRIRIINSGYASVRDQIAATPGFEGSIESEYGAIPLAVIERPEARAVEPFRVRVEASTAVVVEGFHLVGCKGQSGLSITGCRAVRIRRCWIDLFESGATGRSGVHAVGRGVQVDGSGRGSGPGIWLEHCDIGWNHAQRRSVPVRAAGIAVYDSKLRLDRCYVHHNRSTQAPTDVFGSGQTIIGGSGNHRAANRAAF